MATINKDHIITCPHCGREYLSCEIYSGGSFTGRSTDVVRDALGKLIYVDYTEGQEPDLTEKYICDSCNKAFIIEAIMSFKTKPESEELDFNNQYVSLLDN